MRRAVLVGLVCALAAGCASRTPLVESGAVRTGDEIVIGGRMFHTGTPVVLWSGPGGYDAYAPSAGETADGDGKCYGLRSDVLDPEYVARVAPEGWDYGALRRHVDQFVIHYDACGTSRGCFRVLHDVRGLSCHFLLDLDGTVYQTLDVKERAWHATTSNGRSVGIEIANIGAFGAGDDATLDEWYGVGDDGRVRVTLPARLGDGGVRTAVFVARPARGEPIEGRVQGQTLRQYDLTDEQYEALIRLTAALCTALPEIRCDYPRDGSGRLVTHALPEDELESYRGLIGHYHVQTNKVDPGPAFDWERVVDGARRLMEERAD